MCHCVPVEVRGKLLGTGSLFLPCGSQGLNSGCQAGQQDLYRLNCLGGP